MTAARKSGPTRPHSRRKARGRVRVEVYLEADEAACLDELAEVAGSKRNAVGAAILAAYERRG